MKKEVTKKEKDLKKCIFPFIMTIITFIIGCGFFWLSKGDPFSLRIKILFIGYLPSIIFFFLLLICYFKCNTKKSKDTITILSTILTFFLLGYYVSAIFICAFEEAENPITDVRYYKDKVNGSLLKVFPKEIPDDVEKIEFYYAPGILQGGTNYSLYYIDKNMTIDKFDKKYKEKAIWIGHKEEYIKEEGLLTGAFSYTPANYKNEDDYIIYLVESYCDDSGYCNHGNFLLAAYNEKTHEVIFKAKQW